MKIYILTEGGGKFGYGHITRCTSLYDEVKKRNYDVEFVINGDSKVKDYLKGKQVRVENWLSFEFINKSLTKSDLIIVDSYLISEEQCRYLTSKVKGCLFIDDNNRINYFKGTVVNPSIYGSFIDYPRNKDINYLLGKDFIILRQSFMESEITLKEKKAESILITMGGSDSLNLTSKVVKILLRHFPNLEKKIIVGLGYAYLKELEKEVDSNTVVYQNANEELVKEIMVDSDMAITAAGQTIYELIKTSTPFIPIKVVENQQNNIEGIKKLNLVNNVLNDYTDEKSFEKSLLKEMNFIMNKINRETFSERMKDIIDGKGPERIIDILLN